MPESGHYSDLCRPDSQRSCFRCCPPIRPADYDHRDHRTFLTREFLENTQSLRNGLPSNRPITGFSCWGLGFLDRDRRLVGCLLHPAANQGRDLRDLTGYGEKCRRELCREARALAGLTADLADFVLGLSVGLDSFDYSSPRVNPAFRLLEWGPVVAAALSAAEPSGLNRDDYLARYDWLAQDLVPARDRFALEHLLASGNLSDLSRPGFLEAYRQVVLSFTRRRRLSQAQPLSNGPYLHQLGLPDGFVLFLKTQLGLQRARPSQAGNLLEEFQALLDALPR
jgi:hypothetical protein